MRSFFLSWLPLRYDMILITVRVFFFLFICGLYSVCLILFSGLEFGVHWIGMAQVLRYAGSDYTVLIYSCLRNLD
jgi:hypothetical protein